MPCRKFATSGLRIACFLLSFLAAVPAFAGTWYVDKGNDSGTEDGASWATAYTTIQPAIDAAFNDGGGEVWVAAGVYDEMRSSPNADGSGLDTGSVVLKDGVNLYGGFAGSETTLTERDSESNLTVIDGSKSRDGMPAYHTIVAAHSVVLDRFQIRGGRATGPADTDADVAAGVLIIGKTISFVKCHFMDNQADSDAGAVLATDGSVVNFFDCIFHDNHSKNNGGAFFSQNSNVTSQRCLFRNNSAGNQGGAVYCHFIGDTQEFFNCIFFSNFAESDGGGLKCSDSSISLVHCTLFENVAPSGGGIHGAINSTTIKNSILWNNGNDLHVSSGVPAVTYTNVGPDYNGGGVGNISSDPGFADPDNEDFTLRQDSPCLDTGTDTGAPSDDILGNPRPIDMPGVGNDGANTVDMGAYEMPRVVYVNKATPAAGGAQNGQSWATAYDTVQEGIDTAFNAGGGEVWVAAAVYDEARTSPNADGSGLDTGSIVMKSSVDLYGGFAGTETAQVQRDWDANETILDGSTARGGNAAHHVVVASNDAELNGFSISGGQGHQTVPGYGGGGLYIHSVSPTILHCKFYNNYAFYGAAVHAIFAAPYFFDCEFSNNSGSTFYTQSASPILEACSFLGNSGEGVLYPTGGSLQLINSLIWGNTSTAIRSSSANTHIQNCTIVSNTAAGILYADGILTLSNSIVNDNGVNWTDNSFPSQFGIKYCILGPGFPPGGEGNAHVDPLLADPVNGDLRLRAGSPAIDAGTADGAPSTDILGISRPQGAGVDIGAYEFTASQDSDGDGMPDAAELPNGLDESVADAALFATFDVPSPGSSFNTVPVALSGRRSSPDVDAIVLSFDGGATYTATADLSSAKSLPYTQNAWSYSWTPPAPGTYQVMLKASNVFGGFTTAGPVTVMYRPNHPTAVLTSPVNGEVTAGPISWTGSALQAPGFGLQGWVLEYGVGNDPAAVTTWIPFANGATEVNNGSFGTATAEDLAGLPDGPYVNRLTVTDASGFVSSSTSIVVHLDREVTPPSPPSSVHIAGAIVPGFVADGGVIRVEAQAEPGSSMQRARLIDAQTQEILAEVADDLTVHLNGVIRGAITLPDSTTATNVALELRVRDAIGNKSDWTVSNVIAVDNAGPAVSIQFPFNNAVLPLAKVVMNGTADDGAGSGTSLAEVSVNGDAYTPATGGGAWSHDWTPPANQAYTLTVRATDALGNTGQAQTMVTINNAYPSAYISSPAQGAVINEGAIVPITGTGTDTSNFSFYTISVAPDVSPVSGYTAITNGQITTPVVDGLLTNWNTTGLDEGLHTLRLFVFDDGGNFVRFDSLVDIRARLSIVGILDATLLEDTAIDDHVHLPDFASALGSTPQEVEGFAYSIASVTGANNVDLSGQVAVSIDGSKNLDIAPAADWSGTASVTVLVDNGERTDTDVFTVTVIPVNDDPTTPSIAITPAAPSDVDDLVCTVTAPSTDPDGTAVEYTYAWFVSANGVQYSPVTSQTTTALSHTLPNSATSAGEYWLCTVAPGNSDSSGVAASASVRVLGATLLGNMSLSATSARLGVGIQAAVTVSPSSGRTVAFYYAPAGAKGAAEFVNAVNVSGNTYAATLYPPEAGSWEVWPVVEATEQNQLAIGLAQTIDVTKARAALLVQTGSSGVKPGESIQIFGVLSTSPPFPESQATTLGATHLKDQTVTLSISHAGQVVASPTVTTTNNQGQISLPYTPTPLTGTWTVTAAFAGSAGLEAAASQPVTFRVQQTAGYAVLVLGQVGNQSGYDDHLLTLQRVYENLKLTQFEDQNIVVFNAPNGAFPSSVEQLPLNKANIGAYIASWASSKMRASPAPFYVVLVNHGEEDIFHIANSGPNADDVITPENLDAWLDQYAAALGHDDAGARAKDQPVIVVNGSCYSGSFIDTLSDGNEPRRVIIASADAKEESYKGPPESDGRRDGELFVSQLFGQLGLGRDLRTSFSDAASTMAGYTANAGGNGDRSAIDYGDDAAQHGLLDDDGDGVGTFRLLESPEEGVDGAVAQTIKLGFGPSTNAVYLEIREISPSLQLLAGQGLPTLTMEVDAGEPGIAWIQVKDPTFAADQSEQSEQKILTISDRIEASASKSVQTWTWTPAELAPHVDFATPGRHEILYYIANANGELAPIRRGFVYRAPQNPGAAPFGFELVVPEDNVTVATNAAFVWTAATDIDTPNVTYSLVLTPQGAFGNPEIRIEDLTEPYYIFPTASLPPRTTDLRDLETYEWTVYAIDAYGNVTQALNAPRTVTVDEATNGTGKVGTAVVAVTGGKNRDLVEGATVTLSGIGVMKEMGNGVYIADSVPANIALTATVTAAQGYQVPKAANLFVAGGRPTTVEIALTAGVSDPNNDGTFNAVDVQLVINAALGRPIEGDGDVNGDGNVNAVDVHLIINAVLSG